MGQTIIIGGGLTGITCARSLADAGLPVHVLDKGRAAGGRMATRRVMTGAGALSFDHGAQYLRPRSAEFADVLARTGARPWSDGAGAAGHVGVPGMSDIARALGDGLTIQQNTEVTALGRRDGAWHLGTTAGAVRADRVVMTVPAPQAMALLGREHAISAALAGVTMAPCLTLMVAFPVNSPRPFVSRQDPSHPLAWIAQDSTKPGRTQAAVTWVAQADRAFSIEHLDATPKSVPRACCPCWQRWWRWTPRSPCMYAPIAGAMRRPKRRWGRRFCTVMKERFTPAATGALGRAPRMLGKVAARWRRIYWSTPMWTDPRLARLLNLMRAALRPPRGPGRIALALSFGAVTHLAFAAGVLAMGVAMFFGMSESLGRVPQPWAWLANLGLIVQFPLLHSALLTRRGGKVLARLVPGPHGATLATTTYALIASLQLLALFALWTPSGIIWWQAEGVAFWAFARPMPWRGCCF